MAIKVLPSPSSHFPGATIGHDYMYVDAVPRVGDDIRLDAQLDNGGTLTVSGTVHRIETHLGHEQDDSYVIIHFDPVRD